jgi:NDP-4-keto-2,6-dideoxyhexose 3-C-methyltransferase
VIQQIAELASKMHSTKQRPEVKVRTTCRSCASGRLQSVLDLGNLYVSNFADVPDSGRWPRVPLDLIFCEDCPLAQLRHTTPAEWLYTHYWYKSGISATMRAALADIARKAAHFAGLQAGDNVPDIGCNDGTLLRSYECDDVRRVGFEPAENLACEAATGTDRIVPDFFSARPVAGEQFRVVTSIAMFYDLEDPSTFVSDIASILMEEGVWVIEMHYLPVVLECNAFDAICHEHLEYYSLSSLEPLLARHGLMVADVETNHVNGGSFGVYVVHRNSPAASVPARRERVDAIRAREQTAGLRSPSVYTEFGARVRQIGTKLQAWLSNERRHSQEISAYGASTKGNTLLQVFGLDHTMIRSAAERNPEKWGKYTVGTWIPIVSEAEARAHPDNFLVLPWHFMDEIQIREQDFLARGGKLVAPLPNLRMITATEWSAMA